MSNGINIVTTNIGSPYIAFFFQPLYDYYIYHIMCREISLEMLLQQLNELEYYNYEYTFFYQHINQKIYQLKCKIVSPNSIIQHLNRLIHGIDSQQQQDNNTLDVFLTIEQ